MSTIASKRPGADLQCDHFPATLKVTHMHRKVLFFVLVLLAGAAQPAGQFSLKAVYYDERRLQALAAVEKFRVLYEKHDYARLYAMGGPAMRSMSKDQFVSAVETSIARYGKYKSATLVSSSCFPNEVRLIYGAEYEKAKVTEFMIWSFSESQPKLAMYQVSPGRPERPERQPGCPTP